MILYNARIVSETPLDPEDQILIDEEHAAIGPEELADGMAQFDAFFPNDMKGRG